MPVPTSITDLSTTAASNYPSGTDTPAILDDVQRAHAAFIAQLRDGRLALDGSTNPTANLPMNGKKLTGLAAGTANGDSVRYEQFAAQLAASGYQRLPSGLIIQWVQTTTLGSPGGVSTFPIAFPTSCFIACASVSNGSSARYMSTVLINNATFASYADAYPCSFGFIAIGY